MTMINDEMLRQKNPLLYKIAREGGTEPPHSSELLTETHDGSYFCTVCGAELFSADTKFESGSGWPSFTNPVHSAAVTLHTDTSLGMRRTEVRCANCDAHLGHVFPDGPMRLDGSGRCDRYCINGVSLEIKGE